jgi:hypothetical protein
MFRIQAHVSVTNDDFIYVSYSRYCQRHNSFKSLQSNSELINVRTYSIIIFKQYFGFRATRTVSLYTHCYECGLHSREYDLHNNNYSQFLTFEGQNNSAFNYECSN